MKILFLSPHFDDETLAMGGTIYKLHKKHEFYVAGFTGSEECYSNKERMLKDVIEEAEKACQILGVKKVISPRDIGEFRDMHLDNKGEVMKAIIKLIRKYEPDVVATTHYRDFHTDHRALAIASKEATYQAARLGICGSTRTYIEPTLMFGEVDLEGTTNVRIDVFSQLDENDLKAKWEALKCYKSLVSAHPVPFESEHGKDWIWSIARLRGMSVGVKYAEIFELGNIHTKLKFEDIIR